MGQLLIETIAAIVPVSKETQDQAWKIWDSRCHPLRGFGYLEDLVTELCAITGRIDPVIDRRAVVIMGADNGVVEEGVSQTGQEVTRQVLENMGDDITSVCMLSRCAGATVFPVNIGMVSDGIHSRIINRPVRKGTSNIRKGPAMTREECIEAIETGIRVVNERIDEGYNLILIGEMGIGNTTTSSACASVLFDMTVESVTGRGAGLSSTGLNNKIQVIKDAIKVNQPDPKDVLDVISRLGGFDIAGMVGCFIGAAARRIPVIMDGFISGIAAVAAVRLCPAVNGYILASHCTAEPAGKKILEELDKQAVIQAGMHLGEATGAAMLLPILDMALYAYKNLPSFDGGNVEAYEHLK